MGKDHREQELDFKRAIALCADGRRICNCGEAYYDDEGRCRYGCSTNQIYAKYEIVSRLLGNR